MKENNYGGSLEGLDMWSGAHPTENCSFNFGVMGFNGLPVGVIKYKYNFMPEDLHEPTTPTTEDLQRTSSYIYRALFKSNLPTKAVKQPTPKLFDLNPPSLSWARLKGNCCLGCNIMERGETFYLLPNIVKTTTTSKYMKIYSTWL